LVLALLVGLVVALNAPSSALGDGPAADCRLEFGPDLLGLQAAIGEVMGEPTGCETVIDSAGDTEQTTSTGMAWRLPNTAATAFSDGFHRWELDLRGLSYWDTPDATPLLLDGLTDGLPVWSRSLTCPVLYTHEVPAAPIFRRFLTGLLQAGFQPVSFVEVDAALSGLRDVPRGCVVLSFDDALASQLRNAVPVMAEMHVPGLFFVMPAFRDGRHQYLDAAGIRALHDAGHIVGAHTCNHPSLTLLSWIAMEAELDCRHQVEAIVGVPVRYLAYPNGAVNQTVLAATAEAGYRAAFTTRASAVLRADQPLLLPRIRYDAGEALSTIIGRIQSAQ